jgi:parallel beta-helix repeat protein
MRKVLKSSTVNQRCTNARFGDYHMDFMPTLMLRVVKKAAIWGTIAASTAGLVTLSSGSARAATLKVNNQASCSDTAGSNNYCTIKYAVTQANPGDKVEVWQGTYTARVLITRSGTPGNLINITAKPGDLVIVKSTSQGFDLSGAAWVIVNGFTVDQTTKESIRCTLCSNVTLSNNRVTKSKNKGMYITSSSDTLLSDNQIEDSLLTGIDVTGSTNITISGGYVTRSGLRVSTKTYRGIRFATTTASLVNGTETYDNSDHGVYLATGTSGVRIKNVRSHHNARGFERIAAGIESASADNIFESNTLYENEDSGINMRYGGSNALIINNIAYLNGDHGIDVLESPGPKIINNSVYDNVSMDNGIASPRTLGDIRVTTSSMPATADYNIVWASDNLTVYHWNGIYYSNLSSLKASNPGVEVHGLEVNPNWVNPLASNFHLSAGSAAIDSADSDAIATSEIDQDAEGNARCNDPAVANTGVGSNPYTDRGALEHSC